MIHDIPCGLIVLPSGVRKTQLLTLLPRNFVHRVTFPVRKFVYCKQPIGSPDSKGGLARKSMRNSGVISDSLFSLLTCCDLFPIAL